MFAAKHYFDHALSAHAFLLANLLDRQPTYLIAVTDSIRSSGIAGIDGNRRGIIGIALILDFRSGLRDPVRRRGQRLTLSAVAQPLRSNRASDGRQGHEP